jgi:hypothetical protein
MCSFSVKLLDREVTQTFSSIISPQLEYSETATLLARRHSPHEDQNIYIPPSHKLTSQKHQHRHKNTLNKTVQSTTHTPLYSIITHLTSTPSLPHPTSQISSVQFQPTHPRLITLQTLTSPLLKSPILKLASLTFLCSLPCSHARTFFLLPSHSTTTPT